MKVIIKRFVYCILHFCKSLLMKITFRDKRREKILAEYRKRLENNDFSLFSSNCTGGIVSHDLGLPFRSQFVNLAVRPHDFVRYLKKLDYYNSLDVEFPDTAESSWNGDYPVGVIGDVTVHFIHYKTEEEARSKWNERKMRLNKDNIFVVMCERDGCTKEDLLEFDKLPFKNKVVFTHLPYKDVKSAFYIPGFENENELGVTLAFRNTFSAKRYHDIFPFVDWFNGEYEVNNPAYMG